MSEASDPNFLRQIRFTPMRDILRGRLTGRLDVKNRIETSALPEPTKNLIHCVVRQSRLRRAEKIEVADDLIAHFHDGLDANESIDHLIETFGDPHLAAQLIRRAKKRARPLAVQIFTAMCWITLALIAFYICLGVYFFSGTPSVKINYVAQLNQITEQTPPDQRAWPLYRQAMLALGDQSQIAKHKWPDIYDSPQSPALVTWLRTHAHAIDLARQGAEKPSLGHLLSANTPPEDLPLWPDDAPNLTNRSDDTSLRATSGMYLNVVGFMVNLIGADTTLALNDKDHARFIADLLALNNIAGQMRADPYVTMDSITLSARRMMVYLIDQTLFKSPSLFSDDDLQLLSHRLSIPHTAADLIDRDTAQLSTLDIIQRIYTDDGTGNGRITPEGMQFSQFTSATIWSSAREPLARAILWPEALLLMPSRKAMLEDHQKLMQTTDAMLHLPYRSADWTTFQHQQESRTNTPWNRFAHLPLTLMPNLWQFHYITEIDLGNCDGVVVGIALEMYRRQHHQYPESLNALVPNLLPTIPTDRITGGPIHYHLTNGKPVVYSVGVDRDDDGGRPASRSRYKNASLAAWWGPINNIPDGDWVLYPTSAIVNDDDAN